MMAAVIAQPSDSMSCFAMTATSTAPATSHAVFRRISTLTCRALLSRTRTSAFEPGVSSRIISLTRAREM